MAAIEVSASRVRGMPQAADGYIGFLMESQNFTMEWWLPVNNQAMIEWANSSKRSGRRHLNVTVGLSQDAQLRAAIERHLGAR